MKTIQIDDITFVQFETGVEVTSVVNYLSWSKYMLTKLYQTDEEIERDEVTGEVIETPNSVTPLAPNHPAVIEAFNQLDFVLRGQLLNRPMTGADRQYALDERARPTIFVNKARGVLVIHGESQRILRTVSGSLMMDLCGALDRRLPGRLTTAQKNAHNQSLGIDGLVRIIGTCHGRSTGLFRTEEFTQYCMESLPSWMTKFRKNNEKFVKKLESFCSVMSKYYAGVKPEWLQKYLQQ